MSTRSRLGSLVALMSLAACNDGTAPGRASAPTTALDVGAASDVTPPVLTAVSFSPTAINTTASPATVTVNFSVSDDLSGATFVCAEFLSPSGLSQGGQCVSFGPSTSHSGSLDLGFPQYVEAGTWKLNVYHLRDAVGNTASYSPSQLAAAGFPTDLDVTSIQDVTDPGLTGVSFSPTAINTTAGPATVTLNFSVTDDLSGATFVCAEFLSPSGLSQGGQCVSFGPSTSHSGSLDLGFPQYVEAGTWKLNVYHLRDAVGNTASYSPTQLAAAGFPTDLDVTSIQDVTDPGLTGVSFSPTAINTAAGPATVTLNFSVTDDLSGATSVCAEFLSPSGLSQGGQCVSFGPSTSHSGSLDLGFPQYVEEGTWKLNVYHLRDAVGNTTSYSPSQLAAAGFPTDLLVGRIPVTIDIKPNSDPNTWACRDSNKLLPVAILSTPAFDATTVNATSVRFGKLGTETAEVHQPAGAAARHVGDVNGDGRSDLSFHFRFGNTGFSCTDIPGGENSASVTAVLTGLTQGGSAIQGEGTIVLRR